MDSNNLFKKFCLERNIKGSTIKGYESAIKKYCEIQGKSIEYLIDEALEDEKKGILLKNRRIKIRLLEFRSYMFKSNLSAKSARTYFSKIKTFYKHYEIEIPQLPNAKQNNDYQINYLDLPTKKHIAQAIEIVTIDLKALIIFMASSGTAKAETLSLKVEDFIKATQEYHHGGTIERILDTLEKKEGIIPTFYLKRIKTDKYYYTFCTPEATKYIIKYLKTRKDLKKEDKLFNFSSSQLISKFQEINDRMNWGFKGKYRFFRTHTLRKFHASNLGLNAEYIDSLQGRSKNIIHETYIKTNPKNLKEIYKSVMHNVEIFEKTNKKEPKQEFNIIINVFLSGKEYNIL